MVLGVGRGGEFWGRRCAGFLREAEGNHDDTAARRGAGTRRCEGRGAGAEGFEGEVHADSLLWSVGSGQLPVDAWRVLL